MPDRLGWRKTSWWDGFTPASQITLTSFTWIGGLFQTTADGYIWGATTYRVGGFIAQPVYAIWRVGMNGLYLICANKQMYTPSSTGWVNSWGRRVFIPSGTQLNVAALQINAYYRTSSILPLGTGLTRNGIIMLNGFQSTNVAPWFVNPSGNQNANAISPLWSTWKD